MPLTACRSINGGEEKRIRKANGFNDLAMNLLIRLLAQEQGQRTVLVALVDRVFAGYLTVVRDVGQQPRWYDPVILCLGPLGVVGGGLLRTARCRRRVTR